MSASIVELIAERLEVSEEEARETLTALLRELRSAAEKDRVRVPQLGTFQEENGTLTFSPSPSLRRHVNRRYEGLSPEVLPAEPPPTPEEPPPVVEEGEETEAPSPSDGREPASPSTTDTESESKDRTTRASRGRSLDSFQITLGILLFAFLAGIGWFFYLQQGIFPSVRNTGPEESAVDTTDTTLQAGATDVEPERNADTLTTSPQQSTPSQDTTAEIAPNQDSINPPAGGWTIVVASTATRARAEQIVQEYKDRFSGSALFVDVLPGEVNNTTRYRVVLGQFRTKESVLSMLEKQQETLPEGAWILSLP